MVRKFFRIVLWLIVVLPIVACGAKPKNESATAVSATAFQAGKDYEIIDSSLQVPTPKSRVYVTEFFSYGCPACNHFEPALDAWLAKKPKYVVFERVPVVFEPNWDILARAYYTARTLGVAEKLSPLIFKAIHQDGQSLDTEAALADFFAKNGVSKKAFDDTFNFSPGIDAQMLNTNNLMRKFRIMEVPTIVIESKYKVTPRMTNGDSERMLQIVNYLVEKEKTGSY